MFLTEYFLNPGELIFTKKPVIIKTVLGSCVAVVIYDRVNRFGGMCHYLLPESTDQNRSTKYGDVAIPTLINKFYLAGSEKKNLDVSILGGAFVIFDHREVFFIGDRNIEIANRIINGNQLQIKLAQVGGESGRRVRFNTKNNELKVGLLSDIHLDDLFRQKD